MNSVQNFSNDFRPQQGAQRGKRQIPSFAELLLTCAIKSEVPRYQIPQNAGQCYPSPPHLETHMSERQNMVYASPVSPMQMSPVENMLPYQQMVPRDFQRNPQIMAPTLQPTMQQTMQHTIPPTMQHTIANGALQNIANGPQGVPNAMPQTLPKEGPRAIINAGNHTVLQQMSACAPPKDISTNIAPSRLAPAFGHRRCQSLPARPEVELEQKITSMIDYEKQLVDQKANLSPEMWQRLVNYHRYAAKMFQENTGAHKTGLEKPKRKRSNSSSSAKRQKVVPKDEDHGNLSFTVKPIEPKNYDVETPYLGRHYLNKELSVKNNTLCSQCGSTKTPEWRSGPQGCRTLCNACGLFFTKLTKRMGVEAARELLAERKKVGTPLDRRICIG